MDSQWVIEHIGTEGTRVSRSVTPLPFRIGRDPDNELVITTPGLSRHHALITRDISGRLKLVDLNSTNGSFVNRERIDGSYLINDNDIIHFGNAEFRMRKVLSEDGIFGGDSDTRTMLVPNGMLSELFVPNEAEFLELLDGHGMSGAAQPIVRADDHGAIYGYELLGRSSHPLLPALPGKLFEIAGALDREVDLSTAFRRFGIRSIAPRLKGYPLFTNTHPKETLSVEFFRSLSELRALMPELDLVVEIHESAVTELGQLRELVARFRDIGVRFAYDDFGAGQARLAELGEAPADFVKFDMSLVHNLHLASERKRRVVHDLVRLVHDLGSVPVAEGVELQAEAQLCREMGFKLIQGYLTGKPIPAAALRDRT